jgi:hypothetical protein
MGPTFVERARICTAALLPSENALLKTVKMLYGAKGIKKRYGSPGTRKPKATVASLPTLHDPRAGDLSQQLAEIVRRRVNLTGKPICTGIATDRKLVQGDQCLQSVSSGATDHHHLAVIRISSCD